MIKKTSFYFHVGFTKPKYACDQTLGYATKNINNLENK